jgi:plastocyanin
MPPSLTLKSEIAAREESRMEKTTRRNLLLVTAGGVTAAAIGLATKPEIEAQTAQDDASHGHSDKPISGPLAQATVSFGQWPANATVDRMRVANPGNSNIHQLIPFEVQIKAGGTVNFVVAGFHQILVYDDGTQPADINEVLAYPAPLAGLINDPNHRIYVGLSPAGVPANFFASGVPAAAIAAPPQDRTESVNFPNPGTFLVICGVRGHFVDGMVGFVRVLP